MKKIILAILMVLGIAFASTTATAQVYVTDAYGVERVVDYGHTYVYVEVDGEWMKTKLYSTICPTCGHYFDCWHRHYRYSTYTIPAYATVGLFWYFTRPTLAPALYYRHYPVHVHYSYPVYVDYYRVHHHYPAPHVHHSHPAPKHNDYHKPAPKPAPARTTAPRSTVNTRTSAPAKSQAPSNVTKPSPQTSHSGSVRTTTSTRNSNYNSRPQSSSSVTKSSSSSSYRPASSSTRTSSSIRTSSSRR